MSDPGSTTGSIYCSFAGNGDGILLETGITGILDGNISIYLNTGALNVTLPGNVGQKQQKRKTIADSNWHLLTAVFNTSLAAANQLVVKVDNSVTGVSTLVAQDLTSQLMGGDAPNYFCRDAATTKTNAYPGNGNFLYVNDTADDDAYQTSVWAYWQYLMSTIGISV